MLVNRTKIILTEILLFDVFHNNTLLKYSSAVKIGRNELLKSFELRVIIISHLESIAQKIVRHLQNRQNLN
jgi:hypothetical protein